MYINSEICLSILFAGSLILGIRKIKKEKHYNSMSILKSYKDAFEFFVISTLTFLLLIFDFFGIINFV